MKMYKILIIICCLMALLISCSGKKFDPGATARMYGSRASTLFTEGNLTGAMKEYQKAYVQAARADLPLLQAQYLFNTGRVYYEAGQLDSADLSFQAAYREFGYYKDPENASIAAGFIALVYCRNGTYDSAFAWYQRGRPQELKKGGEIAFWLTIQALMALLQNRTPEASAWLDRAYEDYRKRKSYNGMAQIDYYRARIAFSAARYDDARALLASSLAMLDKTPERFRRWRVLVAAAAVSFCLHDTEAGERFYRRALDCAPRGVAVPAADGLRSCPQQFPE